MTRTASVIVVAAIAATHGAACQRTEPNPPVTVAKAPSGIAPVTAPAGPSVSPPSSAAAAGDSTAPAVDRASSVDVSLPRTVTMGQSGALLFTITEVSIEPRNSESTRVVLLVRMQNKQRQPASFADENFRLVTKNSVIPANGGLSETVEAGTESTLERVQFVVPLGAAPTAVKIEYGSEATEVPLTLRW